MRVIRNNIFETNSSSTHTVSYYQVPSKSLIIPRGCASYDVCSEIELSFNRVYVGEAEKLRYVLSIIASQIIEDAEKGNLAGVQDYYYYYEDRSEVGWKLFGDQILQHNWVKWLKELIEEKCYTNLHLGLSELEFPYISRYLHIEDQTVCEILNISESEIDDKQVIIDKFEDLIFNPSVIIDDRILEN